MARFAQYDPNGGEKPKLDTARDLTLRPPIRDDVEALARLSWQREGGELDDHRRNTQRAVGVSLRSPERVFLVAEHQGAIVGYAKARLHRQAEDEPPNAAPEGWYLSGLVVDETCRRRGVGAALTQARLVRIAEHAPAAYYFANENNQASIKLHARFGFQELTRDFVYPRLTFEGGVGVLYRASLVPTKSDRNSSTAH